LAVVLSPDQLRSGAVAAALDDLRAEVGLPATGGAHMAYRYLHLCLMAPRFFHDTEEQCATAHFLRYQARARPGDSISRQFMGLPDHPMVLVSLGTTAFSDNRRIWDALLEGLAGERLNLVLGMGAGPDPESFGPLPPNVLIQRYVPQALLLPRCAAMITNGGFNSVRDALSLGVPLVLIPLAACQPTTAARCAALGLGRVVRPFEATPATIAEAVRAVLDEPVYSSNARAFADELAALPGREEMVGLLEMLAREAKPLVRRS
ncbi:MAG TPA: nucleotide disphospho-sugar-binding domain-containing protein, partial [bacterium]|nr:nucleotide disphospho-sugar-binding domain-containing protein [bacterium]